VLSVAPGIFEGDSVAGFRHRHRTDHDGNIGGGFTDFLVASGVVSFFRSAATRTLDRVLIPGGRIPWFAVRLDTFFYVAGKVLVEDGISAARFHRGDHFGDHAALDQRRSQDGNRAAILSMTTSMPCRTFSSTVYRSRATSASVICTVTQHHLGSSRSS
jgi:hypothetical protein